MLAGGRAGLERWASEFFAEIFRATGKAVRIGHSCAAVTHHRPTTAPRQGRGQSQSGTNPVKARGEEKPSGPNGPGQATHAESEYLAHGANIRPARLRAPKAAPSSHQ
jgi:hypothetical protein